MIYCLLVLVFFATIATGPAGRDLIDHYRTHEERHALEQPVAARVIYLPTASCREAPTWPGVDDAIE